MAAAAFPKMTLEQALAAPNALMLNGGNPLSVIDMSNAINKSPGSSTIRTLSAAASAYGLTGGSYKTTFSMASLGQSITSPKGPDERAASLVAAALTPPVFKRVYEYYKGKKVPEREYLTNTVVREFEVAQSSAETFAQIFLANMNFVGLIKATAGGDWLATAPDTASAGKTSEVGLDQQAAEDEPIEIPAEAADGGARVVSSDPPAETIRRRRPNKLFIGHGRNKKPLEQLAKVLRDFKIPHLIAEDEANVGRPISTKVRETMEQCGAAILIFSADVEYFDKDQKPVWRPSENVSHELGAASVMYGDRIILFKEESVSLASNYSGIGYIPFQKDALEAETNALMRELIGLGILVVSVGGDE